MKQAGVLMAISSLPSRFGIGDFGPSAFSFVDYLAKAGIDIWQILPLNRLGYGNSPYQAYSSIAGDEIFISLDTLMEDGYLTPSDVAELYADATRVDYDAVRLYKTQCLRKAFAHFQAHYPRYKAQFSAFLAAHTWWLYDYSVFLALKNANNAMCWTKWIPPHRDWMLDKQVDLSMYETEIAFYQFLQFIFFDQWQRLKAYANANGVSIMGDMAYYVGMDSVDVWANRQYFLLDKDYEPTHVAGVPPDLFTDEGQRWGNPIYNWAAIQRDDFIFWIERFRFHADMFDCLRIDHFRAFDTYWKIPAEEETAIHGEWVKAPGYAFFDTLFAALPEINLVVEDLGLMRPSVFRLRDHYHFMGMEIMQYSFGKNGRPRPRVLREIGHKIAYTGTHDNQTTLGWFLSEPVEQQEKIKRYLDKQGYQGGIVDQFIQYTLYSGAPTVVVPVCDILGLDDVARMNTPGTVGSPNWEWKLVDFGLFAERVVGFADWVRGWKGMCP